MYEYLGLMVDSDNKVCKPVRIGTGTAFDTTASEIIGGKPHSWIMQVHGVTYEYLSTVFRTIDTPLQDLHGRFVILGMQNGQESIECRSLFESELHDLESYYADCTVRCDYENGIWINRTLMEGIADTESESLQHIERFHEKRSQLERAKTKKRIQSKKTGNC